MVLLFAWNWMMMCEMKNVTQRCRWNLCSIGFDLLKWWLAIHFPHSLDLFSIEGLSIWWPFIELHLWFFNFSHFNEYSSYNFHEFNFMQTNRPLNDFLHLPCIRQGGSLMTIVKSQVNWLTFLSLQFYLVKEHVAKDVKQSQYY